MSLTGTVNPAKGNLANSAGVTGRPFPGGFSGEKSFLQDNNTRVDIQNA